MSNYYPKNYNANSFGRINHEALLYYQNREHTKLPSSTLKINNKTAEQLFEGNVLHDYKYVYPI